MCWLIIHVHRSVWYPPKAAIVFEVLLIPDPVVIINLCIENYPNRRVLIGYFYPFSHFVTVLKWSNSTVLHFSRRQEDDQYIGGFDGSHLRKWVNCSLAGE